MSYSNPAKVFLDTSFFKELARLKLDVQQLTTDELPLNGYLNTDTLSDSEPIAHLSLDSTSFTKEIDQREEGNPILQGKIRNFNTIEEFKRLDKQQFIEEKCMEQCKNAINDINNAVSFSIISFCDLKKYIFYYWVNFPIFEDNSLTIFLEDVPKSSHFDASVELYKKWFKRNNDKWVCVQNWEDEQPFEYKNNLTETFTSIAIRDTCLSEKLSSSFCKNFFTIIKSNYPNLTNLNVYFIKYNDNSYCKKITFERKGVITNHTNDIQLTCRGWCKNINGKQMPSVIDLSLLIDPLKIADQSLKLNLKLMKWRIAPKLDLEIIEEKSALILGSGTLGCFIGRSLLSWGLRKMTFVDNGKVSYSNPVRQPLYMFEDCGKRKAIAAAEGIKKIFPLAESKGIDLNIPMIAHPVNNENLEKLEYEKLHELVKKHDIIFIVTDSREARWLPSILGKLENKIVLNCALGFDSYVIIRQGTLDNSLGCYFCQDIVTPGDSLKDRTLDEMCTVTRPGVAMMCAAQAVELSISLLQPLIGENESILGELPHMIRGFLHDNRILKFDTLKYKYCSACSEPILNTCKSEGWEFVKTALNDQTYIDKLSGLEDMKKQTDKLLEMDDITDWGEDID